VNGAPGVYSALVRHFFGRFFDKESLSPQGEPEANVVQLLGLLAVPGAFFVLVCQPLLLIRWDLVGARYFAVSISMILMAFIVVFEWDALFPDRRDFTVLAPLPLRLHTLFLAKLLALAIFLGLFLADVNFFCILFWPGVDGRPGTIHTLAAHLAAVGAAGLFAALAAAAVQGVLVNLLPAAAFRRVSVCLQTVLMAALVMLLFLTPLLAGAARVLIPRGHPFALWFPGYWFIGLYEVMRPSGVNDPALHRLGHIALAALAGAAALFVLTYLPGYRRHARKMLETFEPSPAGVSPLRAALSALLHNSILRDPAQRAVFHFITQTLTRSAKHRLFLATYAGFGAALAVMTFAPGGAGRLGLPLTLSFILVSGLRAAFNFPSELGANWAFQTSETGNLAGYLAATRKWIVLCAIFPFFALIAPMEFLSFTPAPALFHLAFGISLSVLLMEILFFGFRKVPFTCAYFPGKVNMVWLAVVYVFGFTMYSRTMADLESWLAARPALAVAFIAGTLSARWILAACRARLMARIAGLDYEDAGDPVVRTLDITPGPPPAPLGTRDTPAVTVLE
jgi:hypothetical protein